MNNICSCIKNNKIITQKILLNKNHFLNYLVKNNNIKVYMYGKKIYIKDGDVDFKIQLSSVFNPIYPNNYKNDKKCVDNIYKNIMNYKDKIEKMYNVDLVSIRKDYHVGEKTLFIYTDYNDRDIYLVINYDGMSYLYIYKYNELTEVYEVQDNFFENPFDIKNFNDISKNFISLNLESQLLPKLKKIPNRG